MKILYVITALGTGGAENLLVDVCSGLVPKNEVTVVFLRDKRDFEKRLNSIGIETVFVDVEKIGALKCVFEIKKVIKRLKPDVVHTHLPAADTLGRLAALLSKNVKIFSTIHTEPWKNESGLSVTFMRFFERFIVNCFKRSSLIAISKAVKDFTMETEKIRDDKIKVLYNFIDVGNPQKTSPDFVPPFSREGKYVMVAVARLHEAKGHIHLLRAVDELVNKKGMNDLRLMIIGDGEYRGTLETYVKEHRLTEYVQFLGTRRNVYDYIKMSDLLVLPSVIEGFGLAFLEAHYCRVPVIGSDIPAIKEILHGGENGVLFKSGNSEDLALKIEEIRAGKYDLESQMEKGYEFCMKLSKEAHIEDLIEIYNS